MDSKKEMQDLILSVYIPMVCYFPSRILKLSPHKIPDEIGNSPLFDTLIIFKENGESYLFSEINAIEIYKKEHVFNTNIFKLFEIKGRDNADAFKFLIERYITQVRSFLDAYIWFCENVEQDVSNVSVNAKYNLEYQRDVTEQHLSELESRFPEYKSASTESIESLLTNTNFPTNIGVTQTNDDPKMDSNLGEPLHQKPKTQKRKKLLLPTDGEVDEFLLSTIFNVDFEKNTSQQHKKD